MNRLKHIVWGCLLLMTGLMASCDDRNNALGIDNLPEYDKLSSFSKEYEIKWKTVSADLKHQNIAKGTSYNNIYVTSHYGYIGEIPNIQYGRIRSEYLTQFHIPAGFKFADTPINDRIDSMAITLYYSGYTGDSLAPISVEAYRLAKALPFSKYTISDVSEYVSDKLLGKASYYAGRGHSKTVSGLTAVDIPLPRELGQEIYDKSKGGDPVFASQAAFDKYFPGVYITVGAGTGSILRVQRTALTMYFKKEVKGKTKDNKKDSTYLTTFTQQLAHTSEVPQLSRFANENLDRLINTDPSKGISYIKSPAGVVTELTIPTTAIAKTLKEGKADMIRELNSLPLTLYGEPQGSGQYDLVLPSNLLILPKDSVGKFFEKELTEIDAPYTTYLSTKSSTGSATYIFGNLAPLIRKQISEKPNEDLVLWVVPVDRTTVTNPNTNQPLSSSISNLVLPTAIRLNFTGDKGKIRAIMTEHKKGSPF